MKRLEGLKRSQGRYIKTNIKCRHTVNKSRKSVSDNHKSMNAVLCLQKRTEVS